MTLRIGIDVGGTHTDAVLVEGDNVLAAVKARTSVDVEAGVVAALEAVLAESPRPRRAVRAVMIGTTQFTNAVVARRDLAPTAIVRISLPAGRELPPTLDWPAELATALGGQVYMLPGGRRFDGRALAPDDPAATARVIEAIAASGVGTVAVTSAFSALDPAPERAFAAELAARLPQVRVVMSHQLGGHGILERENAAALNAALLPLAERVIGAFERALADRGLACPLYVSQNDGTLMATGFARRFPALTFASGPTNSLRGASLLTGLAEAIVVDIGGTTADIGVLRQGFPRESGTGVLVGGVRTNFRMPDILALGLGGGSVVRAGGARLGPDSVGHALEVQALAFGGDTLTVTDIAIAEGQLDLGERARLADLDPAVVARAGATLHAMLAEAIDRMRTRRRALPVILVGGGASLVYQPLRGVEEVIRPPYAHVANALGAAHAEVSGEAERLARPGGLTRAAAIEEATRAAQAQALAAGAAASSLRTVDVAETQLAYLAEAAARIRVRVIGQLCLQ